MTERMQGRRTAVVGCGVFAVAMVLWVAGCRSGQQDGTLLRGLSRFSEPNNTALGPNHRAAEGSATITATCEKQSFESARSGLIVSQTGLHEDVFALRSRSSYASIAFGLDDALRLEEVLRKGLKENQEPTDQWKCVQQFEGYLETLTDPMVEQDKLARDLDAAAFKDSAKEAQQELKREQETEALAPKK